MKHSVKVSTITGDKSGKNEIKKKLESALICKFIVNNHFMMCANYLQNHNFNNKEITKHLVTLVGHVGIMLCQLTPVPNNTLAADMHTCWEMSGMLDHHGIELCQPDHGK